MSGFAVGDVVGPYRIDRVVGVGGMGRVLAAHDQRLGRDVAIKVVVGHGSHNPDFQARFQREASVLARLDHPHVIPIFDHGEHEGAPYIVTPLAAGGDLGTVVRDRGSLPMAHAVRACRQVAEALEAAHRVGVVHRDVKPANVLLRDERTDRLHVYLCDFGVARTESSGLTTAGALAGTWNYLAPELTQGAPATPASDVYAVGCLLWECLTGQPPYSGADVDVAVQHQSAPIPRLPSSDGFTVAANDILQRALAKDPASRYRSAAALAADLRTLERSLTTSGGAALGARCRWPLWAAAGAVVVVVAGAAFVAWPRGGDDPAPAPPVPELVAGDIDGDGLGDVGVSTAREGSYVYRSDGTTFPAEGERERAWRALSLLGDVDGDGRPDVVVVDEDDARASIRVVQDDGGLGPATLVVAGDSSAAFVSVVLGDVDGDGRDDVVTVANVAASATETVTTTRVALSRGDGTFAEAQEWSDATLGYGNRTIGDVDGDGREDLVTATNGNSEETPSIQVLLSTGDSFTDLGRQEPDTTIPAHNHLGDVDGDGRPELVGFDDQGLAITVRRFDAEAEQWDETEKWYSDPDGDLFTVGVGVLSDVDGDGDADLVGFFEGRITTFLSTGSAFEPAPSFSGVTVPLRDPVTAELIGPEPAY